MRPQTHPVEAGTRTGTFSSAPSTDVRAAEAEGRMRDEWGVCHNIVSSYELQGSRGLSVGGGFDSAP